MKKTGLIIFVGFSILAASCSKSGNDAANAPQSTPNLKADSERLRFATSKAAEARKREEEAKVAGAGTATATPAP